MAGKRRRDRSRSAAAGRAVAEAAPPVRDDPVAAARSAPPPAPWPAWVWIGLVATLGLLLWHAWSYRFLTDDSFISFRYARHLAEGAGLVFNGPAERVEGYSDFLWVVLLAGLARLGWRPESAATSLSLAATVGLWLVVSSYALRVRPRRGAEWLVLIPGACLALFRSVAVWSTGGLETRLFELLVVGAALRLTEEVAALKSGGAPRLFSGWLWGLAALTRPDGSLLAACGMGVGAIHLALARRFSWRATLAWALPFAVLVGSQLAFRRAYYGEWLPNTYYAKVGGRWWWSSGAEYLLAFALEYALPLWLALAVYGALGAARERRAFFPILCAALLLPHALYVASVGGDHFEFRPLGLVFPLLALLVYEAGRALTTTRARAGALAAALAVTALLTWDREAQSHRQFPASYTAGYPGLSVERSEAARRFLDPDSSRIYRWPGLRQVALEHQHLVRALTAHFVAIRQEEHRGFLATVIPEGRALGGLIASGILPRDVYLATDCVGAIPYYSGARTLDRLGLTDAHVAHGPSNALRIMAHDKHASLDYARERGVDLWASGPVHFMRDVTETAMLNVVRSGARRGSTSYAAELPGGQLLLCELPGGLEALARRTPRLRWYQVGTPEFTRLYLDRTTRALADSLARAPENPTFAVRLAYLLLVQGQAAAACRIYEQLCRLHPEDPGGWLGAAECARRANDPAAEREATARATAIFAVRGDSSMVKLMGGPEAAGER